MKNTYKIFISAVLSLSMIGCGGQETAKSSVKDDTPAVSTQEEDKKEENVTNNTTVSSNLPNTYKVPLKDIYVNAPAYQEIEQGFTELFIVHEQKYVAFTSNQGAVVNTPKEAHEDVFSIMQICMRNYEGGLNYISITNDKETTVNGIDTYYFEGTINYGKDNIHDGYAVGYAFIMDGVPCEIIGSVIDDEQSADTIQEIKDNVDAMMESVRTTE